MGTITETIHNNKFFDQSQDFCDTEFEYDEWKLLDQSIHKLGYSYEIDRPARDCSDMDILVQEKAYRLKNELKKAKFELSLNDTELIEMLSGLIRAYN